MATATITRGEVLEISGVEELTLIRINHRSVGLLRNPKPVHNLQVDSSVSKPERRQAGKKARRVAYLELNNQNSNIRVLQTKPTENAALIGLTKNGRPEEFFWLVNS